MLYECVEDDGTGVFELTTRKAMLHGREVHCRQRRELARMRLQKRWAQAMDERTKEDGEGESPRIQDEGGEYGAQDTSRAQDVGGVQATREEGAAAQVLYEVQGVTARRGDGANMAEMRGQCSWGGGGFSGDCLFVCGCWGRW